MRKMIATWLALFCSLTVIVAAQQKQASGTNRWLERISNRSEFDQLSRTYYRGRFYALPHVMFVIDRQQHNRIYYVNSRLFAFHKDFVNATYLSLERGRTFYDNNYVNPARRFLLGTLAYQIDEDSFTFEFWEGDHLTSELLKETYNVLKSTFYAPVLFKPNSTTQEEANTGKTVPMVTAAQLALDQEYQGLNLAAGIGQLRILDKITPDPVIDRNQIVIFKETPVQLTPLSGMITTEPASPLSHVNLLAKSWSIPNAYIKNADRIFKQLEGK